MRANLANFAAPQEKIGKGTRTSSYVIPFSWQARAKHHPASAPQIAVAAAALAGAVRFSRR
jgi:hypothetical protein